LFTFFFFSLFSLSIFFLISFHTSSLLFLFLPYFLYIFLFFHFLLEGKAVEVDEIRPPAEAYPIILDALHRYSEQRRKGFKPKS